MLVNIHMLKNKNIVLTGGHAGTTGIAVVEELKKRNPDAKISWIGTKSVILGSGLTSLEYKIYPLLGVKYYSIHAGKMQTKFTRNTIPLILMIPLGFIEAFILIAKLKPEVVVSFGGYTSLPVVTASWLFGIPVILHEQTVAAGRASIASAFFARKIALARESSIKYFPKEKCVVTGNPLTKQFLAVTPAIKKHDPFTILVTGGSRGSEFINEEVFKIITELTGKYRVLHITGERDYEKYLKFEKENYEVFNFVEPENMPGFYRKADMLISRSGANSVSEIIYTKRPAILIPLPRTFMDEQYKNAKYAEDFGIAKVMKETEINPTSLLSAIESIHSNWDKIVKNVLSKESPDGDASRRVVDLIDD